MDYAQRPKAELIGELKSTRRRLAALEKARRGWKQKERSLRDSEALFRLISENAEDLIAVLDVRGRRLYNSPSYRNVLGDPKSLAGTDSFNEIHPDDREHVRRIFQETVESGVGQRAEYRFLLRDGSVRYIESQGSVIPDDKGKTSRVVVVARDITDRKEAERVIRLLAQTVSSTRDFVSITDLKGDILFVNDAFLQAYGYTEDELVGKSTAMFLSSAVPEELQSEIRSATIAGGWVGEVLNTRKDGSEFSVELWTSVVRNETGEPVALVGVGRDITERRRAQRVQTVTYRISEAAHSGGNLTEVLSSVHAIIGEIIPARNFYIALYDADTDTLSFPYFADEYDETPAPKRPGKGLTEYVLRTGEPLLATPAAFEGLVMKGEVEAIGAPSIDWLGIPLKVHDSTIGVLVVQSYSEGVRFSEEDKKILMFVSSQVAMTVDRARAMGALRKSEAQFRAVFERAGIGMAMTDLKGKIIGSNQALQDMLGYSRAELKQRTFVGVTHPDDAERELAHFHEVLATRNTADRYRAEKRYVRKDGQVVWGRLTSSFIWDSEGNPLFGITMVEDINERKRGEERLAKLNEALLSFGPDPEVNIGRLVALCGEQLGASSAMYNRLEGAMLHALGCWNMPGDFAALSPAEGRLCYDVIRHGLQETTVIRNLGSTPYAQSDPGVSQFHLQTYLGRPVALEGDVVGSLCVVYRQDFVPNQEDLKLLGIAASAIAVEEKRKRAEEELYRSRQMLQVVLDTIPQRVFWKDRNFNYIGCNRTFAEDAGLTDSSQVVGKTDHDMPWKELTPIYCADDAEVMESKTPKINYEEPLTGIGGSTAWLKTSKVPMFDRDGNVFGVLGTYEDITERKKAQESLRESEERYRRLVEVTPDAIFVHSSGVFLFCNKAGERLMGAEKASQLMGRRIEDFVHPAFRGLVGDRIAQMAEKGTNVPPLEERFVRLDGSVVDVEVVGIPFTYEGKSAVQVVARDITERKRAERELYLEKMRFQQLYENLPLGIAMLDEQDRILRTNKAFGQIFKFTGDEILGKEINSLIVPPRSAEEADDLSRTTQHGTQIEFETVRHRKNGTPVHVHIYGVPIMSDGGCSGIFGIYEDISNRKTAEEKIRQQAALLDIARDAILVQDLEGKILFWNKGAQDLYGWTADAILGKSGEGLIREEDRPKALAASRSVLEKGEWAGEIRNVRNDGKTITVQSHWSLVRDSAGIPESILVVSTDITEKKELEAKFHHAQRLETMGTLAGGIAHDLNNVLAPILMAIELLKPKFPDEKGQRLLNTMETSARRGADIVKQVLTFARGVEGERIILQPKHLLREMEKIAQETFPKSIQLRTNIPKDLWTLSGDATQLHQVLLNLCVNARDAMPQGGLLEVRGENVNIDQDGTRIHPKARPGPYVTFSVFDTGVGIPEENLERIFDPFFTTKEVGKGTGLGLSTVIGIVESHKGFITVSSEWGKGTQFKVYLPAEMGGGVGQPKELPADLPAGHGELILVIDDEASIREITRDILETYGYRVLLAKDGMEAALTYEKYNQQIDVVVTDMMMPNMDGASVVRILRRVNPGVKIIAASGITDDEQISADVRKAVQAFLPKPYKADKLLKALESILR